MQNNNQPSHNEANFLTGKWLDFTISGQASSPVPNKICQKFVNKFFFLFCYEVLRPYEN